jgi:hypothetical protein
MSRAFVIIASAISCVALTGCVRATSSAEVERDQAAHCRGWDADAQRAAHPDAAMIARHDQLAKKAADLFAAAAAQQLHGAAAEAAMGDVAQAQIEAEDVYDAKGKQRIADECWAGLGVIRDIHNETRTRAFRTGDELDSPRSAPPITPDATAYPPNTTPPAMPAPTIPGQTTPPPATTWEDTPYAPMIPPVMRDQPVEDVNPMIPPAAR